MQIVKQHLQEPWVYTLSHLLQARRLQAYIDVLVCTCTSPLRHSWCCWGAAGSVVAVADLHGDLPKAHAALQLLQLVDQEHNWEAQGVTLVQVGRVCSVPAGTFL